MHENPRRPAVSEMLEPPHLAPAFSSQAKLLRSGILPILMFRRATTKPLLHDCLLYILSCSHMNHCLEEQGICAREQVFPMKCICLGSKQHISACSRKVLLLEHSPFYSQPQKQLGTSFSPSSVALHTSWCHGAIVTIKQAHGAGRAVCLSATRVIARCASLLNAHAF